MRRGRLIDGASALLATTAFVGARDLLRVARVASVPGAAGDIFVIARSATPDFGTRGVDVNAGDRGAGFECATGVGTGGET